MSPHSPLSGACRTAVLAAAIAALLVPGAARGGEKVREPILAGTWYPGEPRALRDAIEGYLADGGPPDARTVALIAPHAGYMYSGAVAGKAFAAVRGRSFQRVILLGPSHRAAFNGAALSDDDRWRTPLGEVTLDKEAIAAIASKRGFRMMESAHAREHSLEIEVPFLQVALEPGWKLVPIMVGQTDAKTVGEIAEGIRPLARPGTLVVVSSDFTHFGPDYGYVPFRDSLATRIRGLDDEGIAAIRRVSADDFESFRERTGATICGAEPIRVLLTLLRDHPPEVVKRGYDQSGSMIGSYANSVSYAALAFVQPTSGAVESGDPSERRAAGSPRHLSRSEREFLLKLARDAVTAAVRGLPAPESRIPDQFGPDSPLRENRGVFVTLTERGDLRGCIGNIFGSEPLYLGVLHQAVHSAKEDPRFPPVAPRELDRIQIEISVLTPPVPVPGPEAIEVGRHGVLIEKHGYQAVFLPQVAPEQGWDRETMLRALCRKAGLGPDDWKSGANFQVFEAQVFGENQDD